MKISYCPTEKINNFHNCAAINLVITGEKVRGFYYYDNEVYRISKSQAQRIEKHFCGVSGCGCGAGAVVQLNEDATEFGLRTYWVTIC